MKRKVAALVALSLLAMPTAFAKGKPTTSPTPGNITKTTAGTTEWLLPKENFVAKAGSTISLKFRLATGGNLVKSTSGVTVTATAITCPTTAPSPAPTATGSMTPVKPGKSSATKALRFAGNAFMYQWKTSKTTMLGCYQFAVAGPGGPITGPIVQIVAGS